MSLKFEGKLLNHDSVEDHVTFELKVYQFNCWAELDSYTYQVGDDPPAQIQFEFSLYPDELIDKEFQTTILRISDDD